MTLRGWYAPRGLRGFFCCGRTSSVSPAAGIPGICTAGGGCLHITRHTCTTPSLWLEYPWFRFLPPDTAVSAAVIHIPYDMQLAWSKFPTCEGLQYAAGCHHNGNAQKDALRAMQRGALCPLPQLVANMTVGASMQAGQGDLLRNAVMPGFLAGRGCPLPFGAALLRHPTKRLPRALYHSRLVQSVAHIDHKEKHADLISAAARADSQWRYQSQGQQHQHPVL